jgi:hypothetical protein
VEREILLRIHVCEDGADDELLERSTLQLRNQLRDVGLGGVVPAQSDAPIGTRSGQAIALGVLAATVIRSPELLRVVVDTIRSWASAHSGRSAKLEIDGNVLEVAGLSRTDQRSLIDSWIRRHGQS